MPLTVISSPYRCFFFLAMPHRGRLNLLTVLLQYSPAGLFHKIKGGSELPGDLGAEGDVLSHLGGYFLLCDVSSPLLSLSNSFEIIDCFPSVASPSLSYDGASTPIKVSLLPNPSHLGKFSLSFFSIKKDRTLALKFHQRPSTQLLLAKLGQSNLHF